MKLEMVRLQIIGLKSQLMITMQALHQLGCVQIEELSQTPDVSARPLALNRETVQQREEMAFLITRIEGLLSTFDHDNQQNGGFPLQQDCLVEARKGIEKLGLAVKSLISWRERLAAEQTSLPRYQATLQKLLPIVPASAQEPGHLFMGVLVSRRHRWVLATLTDEVLKVTAGQAETAAEDIDETTSAMLIIVPKIWATEVEKLLGREDISRLHLPERIANWPPDRALLALNQRQIAISQELEQIKVKLTDLAEEWLPKLQAWQFCLRDRLAEIDMLSHLGETDHTFILAGWLPKRDVTQLRETLDITVGEELLVQTFPLAPGDYEQAPVVLANPAPIRPFQSLVQLLDLPRYEGIDPTFLMALFMPLFFGMILGDVAYGILLLLLCLYGLRRFSEPGQLRDLIKILALGAGWSIIFGFLYGEALGTLGEELGMHAYWLERGSREQVISLLLFTIAVGAAHITLGLVLGVWDGLRQRSRHHLLERGGMLVGLIGLFLLTAALLEWLPAGLMTPGAALMILGIVLLSSSLGWIGLLLGPIEFVGLIGNILSYLRIAAVGLASVYVARLANDMAGSTGTVLVGVIIAFLIHALNLVLGAFSPTIHSLRLHYVEFFRKFYEGGGRPFEPFQSVNSKR